MAVKYVRSTTGLDTNGGTTWVDAYATIAKALSVVAAGDTIYVSQVHAEAGATPSWTSPGTAAAPVRILCVNDANTPPTAAATGATATANSTNSFTFNSGYAYVEGIAIIGATGFSASGIVISGTNSAFGWTFKNGALSIGAVNTASTANFTIGNNGSQVDQYLKLINTTIGLTNAAQSLALRGSVRFYWENTPSALFQTTPTTLITLTGIAGATVEISGVDLSALGTGKNLVSAAAAVSARVSLRNCKLGASVSAITGAITSPGAAEVFMDNCDSGSVNYRFEHYKYQGSLKQETAHVRASGGASDGTTVISHNLTTLASGPSLFSPREGRWIEQWNETTGSAVTVTVELCTENVILTNADCYLEVEYLGTSGFPKSVYASSRVADVFATPTNLTTSGVTWSGFTTAAPQNIALTFTPQVKGTIRARICVAKVSATVYVDPQIAISGITISRSYGSAGGSSRNDLSSGAGVAGMLFIPDLSGV